MHLVETPPAPERYRVDGYPRQFETVSEARVWAGIYQAAGDHRSLTIYQGAKPVDLKRF